MSSPNSVEGRAGIPNRYPEIATILRWFVTSVEGREIPGVSHNVQDVGLSNHYLRIEEGRWSGRYDAHQVEHQTLGHEEVMDAAAGIILDVAMLSEEANISGSVMAAKEAVVGHPQAVDAAFEAYEPESYVGEAGKIKAVAHLVAGLHEQIEIHPSINLPGLKGRAYDHINSGLMLIAAAIADESVQKAVIEHANRVESPLPKR